MILLQELLAINEAVDTPVELADIVKNFPNKHEKALQKLWGGKRLTYKGKTFFEQNGDFGEAYNGILEAVEKKLLTMELEIPFDMPNLYDVIDTANFVVSDMGDCDWSNVYLGYDKNEDVLYAGYDVWLSLHDNEDIEQQFERQFKKITGQVYDHNNKEHKKIYDKFVKEGPDVYCMLFRMTTTNGKSFKAELDAQQPGVFYGKKGIFKSSIFKHLNLVNLRLD